MPRVTIKLFASLTSYLPAGAVNHAAEIEVPDESTPQNVIRQLNLPEHLCHLVMLNGHHVDAATRTSKPLKANDVLAIFPPVAGG